MPGINERPSAPSSGKLYKALAGALHAAEACLPARRAGQGPRRISGVRPHGARRPGKEAVPKPGTPGPLIREADRLTVPKWVAIPRLDGGGDLPAQRNRIGRAA